MEAGRVAVKSRVGRERAREKRCSQDFFSSGQFFFLSLFFAPIFPKALALPARGPSLLLSSRLVSSLPPEPSLPSLLLLVSTARAVGFLAPMTTESTPLLPAAEPQPSKAIISPFRRLLLTSLLLSISFVCTVTPLLYSFRVFTCDEYYADHPPDEGAGDPCSRREIESATAKSISLMITLTTVSVSLRRTTQEDRGS